MVEGHVGGWLRRHISIAVAFVVLALIGCGALTLLPGHADSTSSGIVSLRQLASAYSKVVVGATRASQLARLGFDSATPNAQVLSYLGVMERFAAIDTTKFDRLDEALQNCLESRDRCTALVFKSAEQHHVAAAGMFAALGFSSASAAPRSPEVTLLVQNGRVAYKMITGVPTVAPRTASAAAPARAANTAALPVSYRSY
ncbi:MAG: hypothetical protein JO167_10290 [Alphaproteobacteria bacterium]|nr:hypothetical protein [Alphaproteobacteria bacterium]